MSAEIPQRRSKTARELAEKYGISTRQVQNIAAEPREEYLARARVKADQVLQLRVQGLKFKEIAEQMGISSGTVGVIVAKAKKEGKLKEKVIRELKV